MSTPKPVNIQKLIDLVLAVAKKRREDAGYSGLQHDGGATELELQVKFFNYGWDAASHIGRAVYPPKEWQEFEIQLDPEYAQYQKLKKKFGDR